MADDVLMINISSDPFKCPTKNNQRSLLSAEKYSWVSPVLRCCHFKFNAVSLGAINWCCSCYRREKRRNRWKERLPSSHRRTAPSNRGRLIKLVNSTHIRKSCSPPEAHLRGIIIDTQRRPGTREKTQQHSPHQRWKHFQRKLPKNIKTMADHLSRHPLSSRTTQWSMMFTGRGGTFEHHRVNETLLLHTKSQFDLTKQSECLFFFSVLQ